MPLHDYFTNAPLTTLDPNTIAEVRETKGPVAVLVLHDGTQLVVEEPFPYIEQRLRKATENDEAVDLLRWSA